MQLMRRNDGPCFWYVVIKTQYYWLKFKKAKTMITNILQFYFCMILILIYTKNSFNHQFLIIENNIIKISYQDLNFLIKTLLVNMIIILGKIFLTLH